MKFNLKNFLKTNEKVSDRFVYITFFTVGTIFISFAIYGMFEQVFLKPEELNVSIVLYIFFAFISYLPCLYLHVIKDDNLFGENDSIEDEI